jgi:cytochrome c biogenesis protein CcmG/thiol:disulfide interchange protein DsbE
MLPRRVVERPSLNRKVLIAGLVIVVPFIVLLVMNLGRDPRKVDSPLIGKQAPPFSLRQVGTPAVVDLAALRGKPVVLNFWATWCVPCYAEHPVLVAAGRQYEGKAQFVGVVFDDQEDKIAQFLRENGTSYPTLFDDSGKTAIAFGVYGVPETFFIDANGKIVDKYVGPLDPATIEAKLRLAGAFR